MKSTTAASRRRCTTEAPVAAAAFGTGWGSTSGIVALSPVHRSRATLMLQKDGWAQSAERERDGADRQRAWCPGAEPEHRVVRVTPAHREVEPGEVQRLESVHVTWPRSRRALTRCDHEVDLRHPRAQLENGPRALPQVGPQRLAAGLAWRHADASDGSAVIAERASSRPPVLAVVLRLAHRGDDDEER